MRKAEVSFNLVLTPEQCAAGCGTMVTSRVAGHFYQDPLCDPCFQEMAPDLVKALNALRPKCSIQPLETRLHDSCAACGGNILAQRFAGHHLGDLLCTVCFEKVDPGLAALLMLEEAALDAADARRDAPALLNIAVDYSRLQYRLDADRPLEAEPLKPRRKPNDRTSSAQARPRRGSEFLE